MLPAQERVMKMSLYTSFSYANFSVTDTQQEFCDRREMICVSEHARSGCTACVAVRHAAGLTCLGSVSNMAEWYTLLHRHIERRIESHSYCTGFRVLLQ